MVSTISDIFDYSSRFNYPTVDYAVSVAHRAIFTNAAQNCTAGSRTFVHAKIYDEFIAKSVELARNRVLGDPFDSDTEQGPQVRRIVKTTNLPSVSY